MPDLRDLLKRRNELSAEVQALLDKDALTEDEIVKVNKLLDEAETIKNQIDLVQRAQGFVEGAQHPAGDVDANNTKTFESLGEQLAAVYQASTPGGRMDSRLQIADGAGHVMNAASGMSEGVPADGGFLVQQDFVSALLKRTYETGVLISRCRRIPIGPNSNGLKMNLVDETSRATGSRWGGVRVYRENEADSTTASKPKLARINLQLEKLMGVCYATDELLSDSVALGEVISQAFSEEFGFMIDAEIMNGDGAGKCLGILKSGALVPVPKQAGQPADTVVADNVIDMWARGWARSRPNAIWVYNQEIEPQLYKMNLPVGMGGVSVFLPAGGLSQSPYSSLFGRPMIPIEQCEALGDVGDIVLADFSQYLYIDKGGMKAAQSVHVKFLTEEQTFRFTLRNNGQPMWKSALTPYKSAKTLSPFVAIAARA